MSVYAAPPPLEVVWVIMRMMMMMMLWGCHADGKPIGVQADSDWLYVVPWGFQKMLKWVAKRYDNPGIFVTENGKLTLSKGSFISCE
jgi:hypothetical protein